MMINPRGTKKVTCCKKCGSEMEVSGVGYGPDCDDDYRGLEYYCPKCKRRVQRVGDSIDRDCGFDAFERPKVI